MDILNRDFGLEDQSGFYKLADGGMYHAPHFVENLNIKLERGFKDTYNYGPATEYWYWFDTSDQAAQFFTQSGAMNGLPT